MNFSDKKFTYSEVLSSLSYDPLLIIIHNKKHYPYSTIIKAESYAVSNELKYFDPKEYKIINVSTHKSPKTIIRFRNKNNLLKFKLKSSIV